MGVMMSQNNDNSTVCSEAFLSYQQKTDEISESPAFCDGILQWKVHKRASYAENVSMSWHPHENEEI